MLLEMPDVFSPCALVEQSVTPTNIRPEPPPITASRPRTAPDTTSHLLVCGLYVYLVTKHNELLRLETRNKNPEHKELPIILTQLGFFHPIHE